MLLKYAENIDKNGLRLAWDLGVMEKRITNTPVLQYSSELKHSRHDWFWTHGSIDRNGIVSDTTERRLILL
jgi:hypothetical protein